MRRRACGLTLAELVVALALASLSVLAMVAYFAGVHKAGSEGHSQASATSVATEALERMKSDAEYLAQVTATPTFTVVEPSRDGKALRDPRRFTVTVEQTAVDPERRYLDVAVRVAWTESGRPRDLTLETVLLAPDPDL